MNDIDLFQTPHDNEDAPLLKQAVSIHFIIMMPCQLSSKHLQY